MGKCFVLGCVNKLVPPGSELKIHDREKEPIRGIWMNFCNNPSKANNKSISICQRHFSKNSYTMVTTAIPGHFKEKTRLDMSAVPTLYPARMTNQEFLAMSEPPAKRLRSTVDDDLDLSLLAPDCNLEDININNELSFGDEFNIWQDMFAGDAEKPANAGEEETPEEASTEDLLEVLHTSGLVDRSTVAEKDEEESEDDNYSSGSSISFSSKKRKSSKRSSKRTPPEKKKPEFVLDDESSQSENDESPELDSLSNFLIQAQKLDLSTLKDDVNECSICSTNFDTIQLLFEHFNDHATQKKCKLCRKFIPIKSFSHHFKSHQKLPCSHCKRSFKSQKKLREHMLSHESEFRCTDCKQLFSQLGDFKRHELNVHAGQKKKYECTSCRDWFFEERTLFEHVRVHPVIMK